MEKKKIFGIGACVLVLIVLVIHFLYEKNKKYPNYLIVVPNDEVATKLRKKRYYKLVFTSLTFGDMKIPTTGVTTVDYTGKAWPSSSGASSGVDGANRTLSILNTGTSGFKFIGSTLKTAKITATDKFKMAKGPPDGTMEDYDGAMVTLPMEQIIQYSNLTGYKFNRLTMIADNLDKQSLYIYFTDITTKKVAGVKINDITSDIIVIDFFNSN